MSITAEGLRSRRRQARLSQRGICHLVLFWRAQDFNLSPPLPARIEQLVAETSADIARYSRELNYLFTLSAAVLHLGGLDTLVMLFGSKTRTGRLPHKRRTLRGKVSTQDDTSLTATSTQSLSPPRTRNEQHHDTLGLLLQLQKLPSYLRLANIKKISMMITAIITP